MKITRFVFSRSLPRLGTFVFCALPTVPASAGNAVTSIQTTDVTAAASQTRDDITAQTGGPYDVTYNGVERRISSFVSGGQTFVPVAGGVAVARRNTVTGSFPLDNPEQTAVWNQVISVSPTAHTVSGVYHNTMDTVFTSNNIRTGTENLFVNTSANAGDVVNDVERMDYIFSSGLVASANRAFSIFERGKGTGGNGANGGFKIAAITALDAFGVPSGFSTNVVSVIDDSYNNNGAGVTTPANYDVFRFNVNGGPELDYMNNVNIGPQGMAGYSVNTTEFVNAGTTIYGYAVFGEDVIVTGNALVDWTNTTNYVTNSGFTNDVDLIATGAVLFQAVPEPTSAMLGLSGLLLAFRRRR